MREFRKELIDKMDKLHIDQAFARRYLNDGFSGGEKKRAEILQMAMLEPKIAVLDETDSGLDIDALRVVAEGVNSLVGPDMGALLITHYQRLLNYIKPRFRARLLQWPRGAVRRPRAGAGAWKRRATTGFARSSASRCRGRNAGLGNGGDTWQHKPIEQALAGLKDRVQIRISQPENYVFKARKGLDHDIVEQISRMKNEPEWMRKFRHEALDIFFSKPIPTWGAGPERHQLLTKSTTTSSRPKRRARPGTTCRRTSRRPSTSWASPRPSASSWPAWARSTSPKRSTTPCARSGRSRA